MKNDPGIQWIRDTRIAISDELGNDPHRFVAFHKELCATRQSQAKKTAMTAKEESSQYTVR